MGKSQAKHFTKDEIEQLRANPCARYVSENKVMWTLEYRQEMYERWLQNPSTATIREVMKEHNIDPSLLGCKIIGDIQKNFKRHGRPSNGGSNELYVTMHFHTNTDDNTLLVKTGKFRYSHKGITFTDEFVKELYARYPEKSIEDGLKAAGIDPAKVGYQRIYHLKQIFEGKVSVHAEKRIYNDEEISQYKDHLYVRQITSKQFVLSDAFYNDAQPIADLPLSDVLDAFEIDPALLSFSSFQNIQYKLKNWKSTDAEVSTCSEQVIQIHWNIMKLMEKRTETDLAELKKHIPSFSKQLKKKTFEQIHELPDDPAGVYTIRHLLEKIGVSKSCYYSALKNDHYGLYEQEKEIQDDEDRKVIRLVKEYKRYPKGKRMVYMMMKKLTGKQFGLNKIMRLCRKYNMQCTVRKANYSRKAAQELLKRNRKPNLLKRTFRMHRPDEVTLTDVTYIHHGDKGLVYASACKDAVTGVLKAFNGSTSNDLNLVEESLKEVKKYSLVKNAIFHSDQGALYLTDTWQKELKDMGFIQSMSKRGNCWDNAPQESFFGHCKDEVDFSSCATDEEVYQKMADYQYYYNYERPQWSRNKMTPMEYAEYLKNMNDDEYQDYLQKETEKYNKMKENAAKEAIARADTIGV